MMHTSKVACSSSLGHSVDGEFLGFLYILPSSSISVESSSSQSSSSSSGVGVVLKDLSNVKQFTVKYKELRISRLLLEHCDEVVAGLS